MILTRGLLLSLAMLSCEARRPAPDWVRSAPAGAVMAVSFRADWAMEQPRLRNLLEPYPMAGRSLDLLLMRARINLSQGIGRITVFKGNTGEPVIQLGGIRDPGGLQVAIADAFPVEGGQAANPDRPVFVVLDLGPHHIRAMADGEGRVWLGGQAALAGLAAGGARADGALAEASGWISPGAAVQGFIRQPETWSLPKGIDVLAWGVTPGPGPDSLNGFEMALAGSKDAIQGVAPWLERFLGSTTAMAGTPPQAPELLQERTRIGLRCPLTQEQVDVAMAKLDQPPLPCH
jgi:hypothetical protein